MAEEREPPPLDEEVDLFGEDIEDDDIFKAPSTPSQTTTSADQPGDESDDEPVFSGASSTVGNGATIESTPVESEPTPASAPTESRPQKEARELESDDEDMFASAVTTQPTKEPSLTTQATASAPEPEEKPFPDYSDTSAKGTTENGDDGGEGEDKFNIEICVKDPQKIGDGMNAYMVYHVNTVTNIPAFRSTTFSVKRRFSDFLGLHATLVAKHQIRGVIVPKAPEKSTLGMAKVKMTKDDAQLDFIEKRQAALDRYINRTAIHPVLRMDPDFRDFLMLDGDLPKASSTSALSTAGVKRLFGRVGDAVTKMSSHIPETDPWFEEKFTQVESMEVVLRKLHESTVLLVERRHVLIQSTGAFAKSMAVVASKDEHTSLSQVMSMLSEIEENVQSIQVEQVDSDFYTLSELVKDYLSQLSAIKDVFNERLKVFKTWKEAEATLTKKREVKTKLELANKSDKIPQAAADCKEWEGNVEKGEKDFNQISDNLKKEVAQFDRQRVRDFKSKITNYIQKLLSNEEQLIKYWEDFLPEAQSIN